MFITTCVVQGFLLYADMDSLICVYLKVEIVVIIKFDVYIYI